MWTDSIVVIPTITGFWTQAGSDKDFFPESSGWNLPQQIYAMHSN
jgi:hypothetical protein